MARATSEPVVDVRTPAEFARGHIPDASNLPLFSNEERAEIGLIYKEMGKEPATRLGLDLVGPRLTEMIDRLREMVPMGPVLVHCWRGGMRSDSVAWLLNFTGEFQASVLQGGYKSYRRLALEQFGAERPLFVLGGMTGSGKTRVLRALPSCGGQCLDLEALACHKGSAFGALGQPEPPTQQQFENDIGLRLFRSDYSRPLWVEDESRHIGRRTIPEALWTRMRQAPVFVIERPRQERVRVLVEDYGSADPGELIRSIRKIERRLGGVRTREAVEAVEEGDLENVCHVVLDYYDKTYRHGLGKRDPAQITRIDSTGLTDAEIASSLFEMAAKVP
jgi:tRNA 2-selenouridine synthase